MEVAAHARVLVFRHSEALLLPVRVVDLPRLAAELLARLPATPLPFNHLASVMPEGLGTE